MGSGFVLCFISLFVARGFDRHIWYADSGGMFLAAYVKFGYYESMDKLAEALNDALKAEGLVITSCLRLTPKQEK